MVLDIIAVLVFLCKELIWGLHICPKGAPLERIFHYQSTNVRIYTNTYSKNLYIGRFVVMVFALASGRSPARCGGKYVTPKKYDQRCFSETGEKILR